MWRSIRPNKLTKSIAKYENAFLKSLKPKNKLHSNRLNPLQIGHLNILQSRLYSSTQPNVPKDGSEISNSTIESLNIPTSSSQGVFESEPLLHLLDPSSYQSFIDPLVYASEFLLDFVHISTGMPWVPSIMAFALIFRVASIPASKNRYKHVWLRSYVRFIMQKNAVVDPKAFVHENIRLLGKLGVSTFHVFKNYLATSALYMTGLSSVYFLSKDIASPIIHNGLKESGFFWINDLTLMDPYMILPGISILSIFLATGQSKNLTFNILLLGLCGIFFFSTYSLPAAFHIYWASFTAMNIIFKPITKTFAKGSANVAINQFKRGNPEYSNKEENPQNVSIEDTKQ